MKVGTGKEEEGGCFSRSGGFWHVLRGSQGVTYCWQPVIGVSGLTPARLLAFMQLINSSRHGRKPQSCMLPTRPAGKVQQLSTAG